MLRHEEAVGGAQHLQRQLPTSVSLVPLRTSAGTALRRMGVGRRRWAPALEKYKRQEECNGYADGVAALHLDVAKPHLSEKGMGRPTQDSQQGQPGVLGLPLHLCDGAAAALGAL
jgi:hypothetical protein